MEKQRLNMLASLRAHWPEYLIEAWALGMFMVSAGVFTVLFEYPGSSVNAALLELGVLPRVLTGLAMGLTAIALIYSPWGRRSGAHMNPSVTLTFLRLGRVQRWDAVFYVLAQFAGGIAGVAVVAAVLDQAFTAAPVRYVATLPGEAGPLVAFVAEVAISFGLMLMVLLVTARERIAARAGLFAGILVASYITFEGPLSGMSMNPARTFASAATGRIWDFLWLYFIAPPLGMLAAAELVTRVRRLRADGCAKFYHSDDVRCIHCGYEPAAGEPDARPATAERGLTERGLT